MSDIQQYQFSSSDCLFFDANILIYLDGPIGNTNIKFQQIYADAFAKMLKAKSKLFIDPIVLSEFVNRYLRLEFVRFVRHQQKQYTFKEFRGSDVGKKVISNICTIINKRMAYFSLINSQADNLWLKKIINEFDMLSGDFNDCIIVDICRQNNLSLVTHDGDMVSYKIPVLSGNKNLY